VRLGEKCTENIDGELVGKHAFGRQDRKQEGYLKRGHRETEYRCLMFRTSPYTEVLEFKSQSGGGLS
jgi:hypothetical protein